MISQNILLPLRDDVGIEYDAPEQASGDLGGLMDRKGTHVSTRPGKKLKTGLATTEVAILSKEIIFENLKPVLMNATMKVKTL